jgi:hypothetical protein
VIACLAQQQPKLRELLTTARLAVNGEYAAADVVVRARDELAVLGLVSGG